MIKLTDIIDNVNTQLKAYYFKDIKFNGLCELIEKNDSIIPCEYIGNGEYKPVIDDTVGLNIYHRLVGQNNEEDAELGFGRNPLTTETYEILTVVYGNQRAFESNVKDLNYLVSSELKKIVPRKLNLGIINRINVTINNNKQELSEQEGLKFNPDNILFGLNLSIELRTTENCNIISCD